MIETIDIYGSPFPPLNNKKKLLRLFISQFWLYISQLREKNNSEKKVRIASLYHAIMRGKIVRIVR